MKKILVFIIPAILAIASLNCSKDDGSALADPGNSSSATNKGLAGTDSYNLTVAPVISSGTNTAYPSLQWPAVTGATGYIIYKSYSSTGTYYYLGSTRNTSYIDTSENLYTGIKPSTVPQVYYRITAYSESPQSNILNFPLAD